MHRGVIHDDFFGEEVGEAAGATVDEEGGEGGDGAGAC